MDHARDLAAVLGFHRDTIAVSPHGDDGVLQISAKRSIYHAGEGSVHLVVDLADLPADLTKRRACVVADLILLQDTPADLGGQREDGGQLVKVTVQTVRGFVSIFPPSVSLHLPGVLQEPADAKELAASQSPADLQPLEGFIYRGAAAKGGPALLHDPLERGFGLLLGSLDLLDGSHGLKPPAAGSAAKRGGLLRKKIDDLVVF